MGLSTSSQWGNTDSRYESLWIRAQVKKDLRKRKLESPWDQRLERHSFQRRPTHGGKDRLALNLTSQREERSMLKIRLLLK